MLLLACSLPSVYYAVQPGNDVTLCEQNLRQDDASEILLPIFKKFEDWARAYCLTDSTIKKLVSQDVNSREVLQSLDKSDVHALGLTIGQKSLLMVLIKKLKEAEAREAAQAKAREVALAQHRSSYSVQRGGNRGGDSGGSIFTGAVVGGLLGLGAVAAAPFALAGVGFTSAGVALGSVASSMMSSAAIANGGAVAAGSVVSVLQAAGAAGIPVAVQGAVTAGGALLGSGAAAYLDED